VFAVMGEGVFNTCAARPVFDQTTPSKGLTGKVSLGRQWP
jgi:hypothetical protein